MSNQAFKILEHLRCINQTYGAACTTTERMSWDLRMPQPSVRRAIGELRRNGFRVVRDGRRLRLSAA